MDVSQQAQSRIHWQYRNGEKLRQWIDTLPGIAQSDIEDGALLVGDILNIDEREGDQLDIIGRIVGVGRTYKQAVDRDVEQFGEDGAQFGGEDIQMKSASENLTQEVEDSLYRVLIKARIARNNGDATIDNIAESLKFVLSPVGVQVVDNQDMTFQVDFESDLSGSERFILRNFDIVPRPQGVEFLGFSEVPFVTQFGVSFAQFGDERAEFNATFTV